MSHHPTTAVRGLLALGLLVSLPACAEERDDQIIGPAPTMTCCWGNVPDAQFLRRPIEISTVPVAVMPQGGWIAPGRQD